MQATSRRSLRRLSASTVAVALVAAAIIPASTASAAPTMSVGGGTVYIEQDVPIAFATDLELAGGGNYAGRYIDVAIDGSTASEALSLLRSESPDGNAGAISVVGQTVYRGTGDGADPIGSIDASRNGVAGAPLRINFSSAFANASFETGTLEGWTAINDRIDIGVTSIAGFVTQDTSTYPANTNGREDNNAPHRLGTLTTTVQTAQATDGMYGLELKSVGMTTLQGCDVVHGPAVYSAPFQAAAGDSIYFDWRAFQGSDNFHVFGYILDSQGRQTEVLDATGGGTTPWTTKETIIPLTETYRFVFVAGTHDLTCGRAAGASLVIDNVRVFGAGVDDAAVQQLLRLLTYSNSSDTPETQRTVSLSAVSVDQGTASTTVSLAVTPVDDPPAFGEAPVATFVNSEGEQSYPTVTGVVEATDPEDDPISYSIVGGESGEFVIDGVTYTQRTGTPYGEVYLDSSSGRWAVVPDSAAIDQRLVDDSTTVTLRATSLDLVDETELTIVVSVPPTPPGVVTELRATPTDGGAVLSWVDPTWIGGSSITGWSVQYRTADGDWQAAQLTSVSSGAAVVGGLVNGLPVQFRVAASNTTGTGASADSTQITPRTVPDAPQLSITPGDRRLTVSWEAPASDGGSPVTGYTVSTSTNGSSWIVVADGLAPTARSRVVTALVNGTPVSVRVIATNAAGPSAPGLASGTPRTVPDAPRLVSATPDDTRATLSWLAPQSTGGSDITGYRLERRVAPNDWTVIAELGADARSHKVAGLINGVSAEFRVRAINIAGAGAAAPSVAVIPRAVPGAPSITAVAASNRMLVLSIDAPASSGGADIVAHQYSLDGGATWRDVAVINGRAVVGGLVNGTEYTVVVRVGNAAGWGPASTGATGTPRLGPVLSDPANAESAPPAVAPGQSTLLVNGEKRELTVVIDDGTWTVSGDGFTVELQATEPDGSPLRVDSQGRLVVLSSGVVTVSGTGFKPGSTVDVWIFSEPHFLGTAPVDANGEFTARFPLPDELPAGNHTIQLNGVSPDDEVRTLSTGIVVYDPIPGAVALAVTGASPERATALAAALLVLGVGILVLRRRIGSHALT